MSETKTIDLENNEEDIYMFNSLLSLQDWCNRMLRKGHTHYRTTLIYGGFLESDPVAVELTSYNKETTS